MRIVNASRGFTLVELTITVGLLSVLVTGLVTLLNPVTQLDKGQDVRRKSDLNQIQKALELYYHDNGRYPPVTSGYRINNVSWGNSWQPYMGALPKDPSQARTYIYTATADGQSYWLYANLARGRNDPQSCTNGIDCPNVPGSNLCGNGAPCNYGVTSPNVSP